MSTYGFDPLVPRPIDLPTPVPLDDRADLAALDDAKIFAAPDDPSQWPAWREWLRQWREDARRRYRYAGAAYDRPEARWAGRCYAVAQVWLWDELLFDFDTQQFTPHRLLADARQRFGGLDAVVLWHAYPVIGIDDRNQWDYYRLVPGIERLVADLHAAGVKVFVDYNPWDTGTRRAEDDVTELASLVKDLEADGVFLDTLRKADDELVTALEQARRGIVLEGESKLATERIADHSASWAQFFADSAVPGVLRAHWYERRHMQHHTRRWHRDHSEELQSAWLNGVGVMVWEVVFGVWVGWSDRDAATLRRMLTVQRAASDVLVLGRWTPLAGLTPRAHHADVYASRFEHDGVTLWALVNRGTSDFEGQVLPDESTRVLVPGRGIAALIQVAPGIEEPAWVTCLRKTLEELPIERDAGFPHRVAHRVPAPTTTPVPLADVDKQAVVVPAGDYVLTVRYRARETGMYQGAPYVDEWKPLPPRLHDARVLQRSGTLAQPVAVQVWEVSNAEFAQFLEATGYEPAVPYRFLQHWRDGRPAPGTEDQPVTFVDLPDARAYCAWRGGRLPSEDEWQLAGQTGQLRRREPSVWNWTESEHSDGRSRYVMLKGGSHYRAEGSEWYFDGGEQPVEFTGKLLLPGLGQARSSSIGFRCCWVVEG